MTVKELREENARLREALERICDEAAQLDAHCKPPVLISYDKIIQARIALDVHQHKAA